MKLNEKAQHLIEYMLLVAAVVAGTLGVVSSNGLMNNGVQNSLNRAVETIYGDYYWKLGVASPCSVLPGCGNGTQTRTVVCASGTGSVVDDGLCAGKGPKPLTTIDCNIACGGYGWWQSGFGPCSVACGPGTQSQVVECRDAGGVTVADALCGPGKPPESIACDNGCYAWVAGTTCTGLCSEPCGIGTCTRSVVCQHTATGVVVPDANCPGPKPGPTIACNTAITCGYQWVVDDWGPCDQSCGPGFKNRSVTCRRIADNALMPDANCGLPTKPVDQLACNLGPCNHWAVEGAWSKCTKPCGTGNQDANIVCKDKDNITRPDANCPVGESGPKPASNRLCNTGACTWGTNAYGACSTTCGTGTQVRDIWCYHNGAVDPLWGAKFSIAWCGSPPGVPPAAAPSCSDAPANIICTQSKSCNDISTCCGNGVVNNFPAIPYSEQCDLGAANNGSCPKACSSSCTNNVCPYCGDGIVNLPGEECDNGVNNGACPKACSVSCTNNSCPVCGNGILEAGEACDNGVNNGACPKTCSASCTNNSCPVCGNGILEAGEACDNGVNNGACPKTCSSSCTNNSCTACGNGTLEAGEQCDSVPHCTSCTCDSGWYPGVGGYNGCYHHTSCGPLGTCNDGWVNWIVQGCAVGNTANWTCAGYDGSAALGCSGPNATLCPGCGNGLPDAGEACDLGDAFHGNGNGVCPKTCSATCTNNSCSVGSCNVPGYGVVAHGTQLVYTDWTPNWHPYPMANRCQYSSRDGRYHGSGNVYICNNGNLDENGMPWGCTGACASCWVDL